MLRTSVCRVQPHARFRTRPTADVLKLPLLHLDDHTAWLAWLDAAGVADTDAIHGPILNRASMLIDAAVDGQGIALARTQLAAWDLINRRLVRPFPIALPLSKSYWIVSPKATASLPKLVAFREWLLAQASENARRLDALGDQVGRTPKRRNSASKTWKGASTRVKV